MIPKTRGARRRRPVRAREHTSWQPRGPFLAAPGAPPPVARRGARGGAMDSVAAAATDKASSVKTPPKRNRVADAIRAWQRCPKAWRAKLVEGGEPGTSEVEKLKSAEKKKGT